MGSIIAGKPQIPTSTAASPGIPAVASPGSGLYWNNVDMLDPEQGHGYLGISVAGFGSIAFSSGDPGKVFISTDGSGGLVVGSYTPNTSNFFGQPILCGDLISDSISATSGIKLTDPISGKHITLEAPFLGANHQLIFPNSDGVSGASLTTDGLGNLSWVVGGGGGGVSSFNTRTGAVTLLTGDVTDVSHGAVPSETTNTALGSNTLSSVTTGKFNGAFGLNALAALTTGFGNTGIGWNTLQFTTTPNGNTAIGSGAMSANTTGDSNTALGGLCLNACTTGIKNTVLGDLAGQNIVAGSSNVFIGYAAGNLLPDVSDTLVISNTNTATPLVYGSFDNTGGIDGLVTLNSALVVMKQATFMAKDDPNLVEIGSIDAFSRKQIWNYLTSAILRLGSWQSDGDPINSSSEGIVVYGDSLLGNPIAAGAGGYARVKQNRFGLFTIEPSLPAYAGGAYYFRVDNSAMFYANNAGVQTFSVQRTSGNVLFSGTLSAGGSVGTAGQVLTSNGASAPTWQTPSIQVEVPFSFGDTSPVALATVAAGKIIYGVQVHIKTPFDGVGASLAVGDAGQVDRLMTTAENDPTQVCANTTTPEHVYGVNTAVTLSITPGSGATQGAGLVILNVQR